MNRYGWAGLLLLTIVAAAALPLLLGGARDVAAQPTLAKVSERLLLLGVAGDSSPETAAHSANAQKSPSRRLSTSLKFVVRGPVGTPDLDANGVIARSTAGLLIVSASNGTKFVVFDSAGRLLRTIGREGDGPGEFRRISSAAFGPGDSLMLVEATRRVAHLFDPSFTFVRQYRLPMVTNQVIPLPDGSLVLSGLLRLPSAAGLPLHRVSSDRSMARSFGPRTPFSGPGTPPSFRIHLVNGAAGRFWSVPTNQLALHEWSDTTVVRSVVLDLPWFPIWHAEPPRFIDKERPVSRVADVALSTSRFATLLISTAAEKWEANAADMTTIPAGQIPLSYLDRFLDSRLLVVDLDRRTVHATSSQSERLVGLLGSTLAFSIIEDTSGQATYRIWSINLD